MLGERNPNKARGEETSLSPRKKPRFIKTILGGSIGLLGGINLINISLPPSCSNDVGFPETVINSENLRPNPGHQTLESQCFMDDAPVPCSEAHNREVVDSGQTCDKSTLLSYLAPRAPESEVLSPTLRYDQTDRSCIVSFPFEVTSSLKGKWKDDLRSVPELRACYVGDERSAAMVGCDEPHNGEVVHAQDPSSPSSYDCDERTYSYLNAPKEKWSHVLIAKSVSEEHWRGCVAITRDGSWLRSPLRNIHTTSIDTKASG